MFIGLGGVAVGANIVTGGVGGGVVWGMLLFSGSSAHPARLKQCHGS